MIPLPSPDQSGDPLAHLASRALHDPDALSALIRGLQTDVWRLCASLVDREVADDLTQETFLRLHQALPSFRGDSSVRTWALSIARRVAMDHLRRLSRRRALDQRLRQAFRSRDLPLQSEYVEHAMLAGLDADQRTAFVLTQLLGLEYAEAAVVMGCAVGTIRSRVARARAALVAQHQRDQQV